MIDLEHGLPDSTQAKVLKPARGASTICSGLLANFVIKIFASLAVRIASGELQRYCCLMPGNGKYLSDFALTAALSRKSLMC